MISKEIAATDFSLKFIAQLDSQLTTPNRNKLLAVSIVIRNMLPNLKQHSQIPELLTANFMGQVLQYYRTYHNTNYDEEFQACMVQFFDSLVNSLKPEHIETKVKIAVIKTIIFYPGTFMIESITKLKVLQQLVHNLDAEGVKKLSKLYKEVIVAKKEKVVVENFTEPWSNAERIYAAQLLVKLLSHASVQSEMEWKIEYLKLFVNLSIVKDDKYLNVGNELAGALRDIFFRALDQKFSKLEDMHSALLELVNHLKSEITPDNYENTLRVLLTEEEFDILQQMFAVTAKRKTKSDENKYTLVFQILFLHMGLQLFKDKELAVASLKELFMCYEKVQHEKKRKSSSANEENNLEWIEVVVDLFLNLLSHNSHLLRSIIGTVFPHLCKFITPSSMHQILSVLNPENETNPLSVADDSDSEESDDDDDDDEEEDEDNESDENQEEDSENEADENETLNDKLRMAVSEALGKDGSDAESIDLDDMSDTEGQRLDEALAEAFGKFKPNRGRNNNKQTRNEQTLTHFRARALDLIEIYLDSEPAMLSCLEIMLSLLQTLEFTIRDEHQNPLQMRVKHSLKKLTTLKKFSSVEGITETILEDLLSSLVGKGTKSTMMIQDMSNEISECCIFIIKCSQNVCATDGLSKKTKKKMREKVIQVLSNAINVYFNQRDCLIPYSLFKSIFNCNWDGLLELAPLIFGFVYGATIRQFRKHQALELLKIFYLNRRIQSDAETFELHIGKCETQFCEQVINMLDELCQDSKSKTVKERFIYHLFHLLKAMTVRKNEDIDWKIIGEKVREYRSYVSFSKDAKTAYNQLCSKLNIPNIVKMKNQVVKLKDQEEDDDDEEEDSNNKPGKKKDKLKGKNMRDNKKLKKEARALRIQSLSEGLSTSFSFSNIKTADMKHATNDEERNVKKHKLNTTDGNTYKKRKDKHLTNGGGDLSSEDEVHQESSVEIKKNKSKKRFNGDGETHHVPIHAKKKKHN